MNTLTLQDIRSKLAVQELRAIPHNPDCACEQFELAYQNVENRARRIFRKYRRRQVKTWYQKAKQARLWADHNTRKLQ